MATESRHPAYYTRYGNPTVARAEQLVAGLEGAETALLASTGMGAISTTILSLVGQGDHIVAQLIRAIRNALADVTPGAVQ